jgi:xylulokinase
MALRWFRDQFYAPEVQSAAQAGADAYDWMTAEAARVPPGAEGLVVLPHLEGAACPEFNPRARAVFFGATLRHTRAHFVRGILEAVAYMLRKNLEIVESLGVSVSEVRSMGGGARSRLWLQIKADMLQKPVACLETEESALLGAAILGAAATGGYASLEEAAAQMARVKERIEPNPANQQVYDQGYAAYLKLYKCLYELF